MRKSNRFEIKCRKCKHKGAISSKRSAVFVVCQFCDQKEQLYGKPPLKDNETIKKWARGEPID